MGWGGRLVPVNRNALGLRILQQRPVPLGKPPKLLPQFRLLHLGGVGDAGEETSPLPGGKGVCCAKR